MACNYWRNRKRYVCATHYDTWVSLTHLCTVIKQGIALVTVRHKFKCPYSHWDKEFHICKPRNSANYQNKCKNLERSNTSRCFENKTTCWNLDSHKKMCRMKQLLSSIFLRFSVFRFPLQIHFIFILATCRTVHAKHSFQQHFKTIKYVPSHFYISGSLCSPS